MNTVAHTLPFSCTAALALTVLVGVGAAAAEPQNSELAGHPYGTVMEKRTVRYSDLDLTVQSDVMRLYRRIERAAAAVCGGLMPPLALRSPRYGSCRGKALADAVHRVNVPQLTAVYESKRRGGPGLKTYASASER